MFLHVPYTSSHCCAIHLKASTFNLTGVLITYKLYLRPPCLKVNDNTMSALWIPGLLVSHCTDKRKTLSGERLRTYKFCVKCILCWKLRTSVNLKEKENSPTAFSVHHISFTSINYFCGWNMRTNRQANTIFKLCVIRFTHCIQNARS